MDPSLNRRAPALHCQQLQFLYAKLCNVLQKEACLGTGAAHRKTYAPVCVSERLSAKKPGLVLSPATLMETHDWSNVCATHLVASLWLTDIQALRSTCRSLRIQIDAAPAGAWLQAARSAPRTEGVTLPAC